MACDSLSIPVYPIAWLHVSTQFLTDVRNQLDDVIRGVQCQTGNFTVPVYDIFLPTEGDFERLRTEIGVFAWMFPEALEWPNELHQQMAALPLSNMLEFQHDFRAAIHRFETTMNGYGKLQKRLNQWIKGVNAEGEKRQLRDAPV